ncbi:NUDIX hydrolase [Meridianimarinicoccus sp. RP-17]|uniref:NUDIX hydrolase n=1 Tax=Meridianimarinicoccus zhengii TaxID=2056810 RepID=UPI000DAE325F|nr:NUDIX hydrolase [Phycocomes zhengii]
MELYVPVSFSARIPTKDSARPASSQDAEQFGALCYREKNGKIEILLITSRGTGRWIVPKGWPVKGQTPAGSATVEAFEEAGVEGRAKPVCAGVYGYDKLAEDGRGTPVRVALFPLRVRKLRRKYPEAEQRKRRWFSRKRAAELVDEAELKTILRSFDPAALTP